MALKRSFFAGSIALALTLCRMAQSETIFDNPANRLVDPAIIASQTPHSAAYVASNVLDGIFGTGSGEYATTNAISGDAFIDFDFGVPKAIGGFVFYQRLGGADGVTGFQLVCDDNNDFSSPLATKTFATSGVRDFTLLNDTAGSRKQFEFPSGVNAQYVRWGVVSAVGNGYDGAAEMEFWTGVAVPEPAACIMALAGIACGGYVVRRRWILSYACLLLALAVVPSAVHAATFFTDDFNSSAANGNLTVPAGWTFGGNSSPAGVAQNNALVTDPGPEPPDTETTYTPRTYVSTVATNFNSSDFIYEITFAVGGGGGNIAFFGIGSGQPNTAFYDEPYSAFFLRQFPSSFSSGETGWTISSPADPTQPSENTFPSSGTGDGTYRAQLVKSGNSLTLGIDANFTGGPFAADFTVTKNLLTDLSFLGSTNSALFFGTAGTDTTFDNLSITSVPEPSTCAMALAGLACGGFSMWRRRKRAAA